jgi:hypothetical protein
MTPTEARCRGCPATAGGCSARLRGTGERCCIRCSHDPNDPDDGGVTITLAAVPRGRPPPANRTSTDPN